jgi:hypothetical protein
MEVDISDEKQISVQINNEEIIDEDNDNNNNNNINEEGIYIYIYNPFQLFRHNNRKPNHCKIKCSK